MPNLTDADKVLRNDTGISIANRLSEIAATLDSQGGTSLAATDIADLYDNTKTYIVGDYVINNQALYRCIEDITTPEDFDSTKWRAIKIMSAVNEEIDEALELKADKANTYTKVQVNQVAEEVPKVVEYSSELSSFTDKTVLGGLEELKADIKALLPIDSASGAIATFETNLADELQSLKCEINASGGGGTPSTPIPIVGHSELNLTRFSVNLWDEQTETGYYDSVMGEKKPLASEIRSTNLISVKPNTTYAKVGLMAGYSFIFFDSAKNFISRYSSGGSTFTTPANCYYIGINFGGNYGNTYNNDVSINYPSTDTDYHPYNGQTFTVAFGQTVYGGVYDKSGRLTITHGIKDLGTLNYNYDSGIPRFWTNEITDIKHPPTNAMVISGLADIYKVVSFDDLYYRYKENGTLACSSAGVVSIINTAYMDAPTFKTAMSGKYLVYELATPIVIDVPSISVFAENGTNNITSDCGGDVNVSYKDTIQHYIDSKIAG